jgi:NAD(P)-dependent dehydrogenase (short-subunit alcohol dehydrogenase family)
VLIIGGTSGIGDALAKEFVRRGDRVVVCSRRSAIVCDVRDEKSVARAIVLASEELGRIDLLVNMAGVAQQLSENVRDSNVEDLEAVVQTNVLGTLIVAKQAALLLCPGACLVLCGGAGTNSTRATPGYATYAFSKAGLAQLVSSLAAENPALGVHLLVPGIAITPLLYVEKRTPQARWFACLLFFVLCFFLF